jgi:kynurenine formamidase
MLKKLTFSYQNLDYQVDISKAIDISIPLKAGSETVNCYYADEVLYETIAVGDFVGKVSLGGSCNYQRISLTPHGNGTHTECYGHIAEDGATINQCLKEFMFLATLISVPIEKLENGDSLITLKTLQKLIENHQAKTNNSSKILPEALIIRTLPNNIDKLTHHYSGTNPPYLEASIGQYLKEIGVKHLLLDLPSVDKEWDNGMLSAHRYFWNLPPRYEKVVDSAIRKDCTITELIFVPNNIADGNYLLNLQIASFESDASPSKPILYALT